MNSTIENFISKVREAQLLSEAPLAELEELARHGELSNEAALLALMRQSDEVHVEDQEHQG